MTMPAPDCEMVTAIATPFTKDNQVDHPALERLANHLIETGSDGILVNGSTGESPTVKQAEKNAVLQTVKGVIGDKPVKLIAGSSTNCTQTTIDMCLETEKLGVDALLVVTPYYNKPSQEGLKAHYGAVAEAVNTPIIIYNIPSRSVINMLPETMAFLDETYDAIVGVKQSFPDMDQVTEIHMKTSEGFRIWSGDDSLTLPMMALGGYGVVSVSAHVLGQMMRDMIKAFKAGQTEQARAMHCQMLDVFKELFFLPNPTVLKACLANMGLIQGYLRLPLVEPDSDDMMRIERLVNKIEKLQTSTVVCS